MTLDKLFGRTCGGDGRCPLVRAFINNIQWFAGIAGALWLSVGSIAGCGDSVEDLGETTADTATGSPADDAGWGDETGDTQQTDSATGPDSGTDTGTETTGAVFPDDPPTTLDAAPGGRPARVFRPKDYDPTREHPLVVVLHGYGATGLAQSYYFTFPQLVDKNEFVVIAPDGLKNDGGSRYWNGANRCCTLGNDVDDVGYIKRLVEEAKTLYNIDAGRVYAVGHSNGGFMAYRLACEASEVFTAIASLAGAAWIDPADCAPLAGGTYQPVSVLSLHGTGDATIAYTGGSADDPTLGAYPGARASIEQILGKNGCDVSESAPIAEPSPLDLDTAVAGDETTILNWTKGCRGDADGSLWTLEGSSHIPPIGVAAGPRIVEWLFARDRTP